MTKFDRAYLRAVLAAPVDVGTAWVAAEELAGVCKRLLDELDEAEERCKVDKHDCNICLHKYACMPLVKLFMAKQKSCCYYGAVDGMAERPPVMAG